MLVVIAGRPAVEHNGWPNGQKTVDIETLSGNCWQDLNDDTDLGYLLGLLKKDVWLGMDRYPGRRVPSTPDWEQRIVLFRRLYRT